MGSKNLAPSSSSSHPPPPSTHVPIPLNLPTTTSRPPLPPSRTIIIMRHHQESLFCRLAFTLIQFQNYKRLMLTILFVSHTASAQGGGVQWSHGIENIMEWNGRSDIRGYWRKTFCSIMHTDKVQWEFGKSIFILALIPFLLDTFQEWTVFRVEIFCQLLFQGQISFNSRTIRGPQVQ